MTRINVVPVEELSQQHLVAEYREITRLPGNLKKSLDRKGKPFNLLEIPPEYVLGPGHVKFFYDKMSFLQKRFESLVTEMLKRGYNPTFRDSRIFVVDNPYYNDYNPTTEALELNRQRIKERTRK
jgi:deoxyribonuclease (pyrimidine dimer)